MKSGSKAGLAIGIVAVGFIVFAMMMTVMEKEVDEKKKFQTMSNEDLDEISVKWRYVDLIKNSTGYQDQVIFISGTVIDYPFLNDFVGVQTGCSKVLKYRECDIIFVQTDTNYLVDDKISGYVFVNGLHELISKKPVTGALVGEEVPRVQAIRLTCDLC